MEISHMILIIQVHKQLKVSHLKKILKTLLVLIDNSKLFEYIKYKSQILNKLLETNDNFEKKNAFSVKGFHMKEKRYTQSGTESGLFASDIGHFACS